MKQVIFISHTSRLRDAQELYGSDTLKNHQHRKRYLRTLIESLAEGIESRGVKPWLDRLVIEPSEDFQPAIALGLASCSGAVVLVDRDALTSSFMRDECVFLGWRNTIEPEFQVLPVLLGGVTEMDFAESPLGSAGGLAQRCSALVLHGKANVSTAPQHAQTVVDHIRVNPHRDPSIDLWIDSVEAYIAKVPESIQRRAAEALGIPSDQWAGIHKGPRFLAAALLNGSIQEGHGAFQQLRDYLSPAERRQLGKRIVPLWVELSTATKIVEAVEPNSKRSAIVIGTSTLEQAKHSVERGYAQDPALRVPELSSVASETAVSDLVEEFDETLREAVGLLEDDSPAEIRRSLVDFGVVVFALIDGKHLPPRVNRQVITELLRRFPGFVFGLVVPAGSPAFRAVRGARQALAADRDADRTARRFVKMISTLIEDDDA